MSSFINRETGIQEVRTKLPLMKLAWTLHLYYLYGHFTRCTCEINLKFEKTLI